MTRQSAFERAMSFEGQELDINSLGPTIIDDGEYQPFIDALFNDRKRMTLIKGKRLSWLSRASLNKQLAGILRFEDGRAYAEFWQCIKGFQERMKRDKFRNLGIRPRRETTYANSASMPLHSHARDMEAADLNDLQRRVEIRFHNARREAIRTGRILRSVGTVTSAAMVLPWDPVSAGEDKNMRYLLTTEARAVIEITTLKPRGKKGRRFGAYDDPKIEAALEIIRNNVAISALAALNQVIPDRHEIAGRGTPDNRFDRIYKQLRSRM